MIASQLDAYAGHLDDPQIEAALGEARCETDPASAFEEGILNPLHKVPTPAGGSRYILIDALDEALMPRDGLSLVALLAPARLDRLPGWLRVVVTTRKEPDVLRRLSGLRAEEIRADEPDNLDDIELFLAHRLGQAQLQARLLASKVTANEAIRRLREASGGNFLWTEHALLSLEAGTHRFADLDALPPGLTGLYAAFFERQFPDVASYAPARLVLEVVAAAQQPLTTDQLAGVTGLEPDYELPAVLDTLAVYLPDRDGRRAVHHKSLADWLTETTAPRPAGRFFASLRRGHQQLAAFCWTAYQGGVKRMPAYSLRHLPAHLIEAARWDDLAAVLRDPPYLEARVEDGQIFDLTLDFTRAGERLPADHPARSHIRLVEQALRLDLYFLARHPTALFACLWNRCWWYDCPQASAHYDPPFGGWPAEGPPWVQPEPQRLSTWLESWRGCEGTSDPTLSVVAIAPAAVVSSRRSRAGLPPRAHFLCHERGVRPRRPPRRQRV